MAIFAGYVEGTVRIAGNRFRRRTLRPLSEGLEGNQKNEYSDQSSTEHGATSLGIPIPLIRIGRCWAKVSGQGRLQQLYWRTDSGHVAVQDKRSRGKSPARDILKRKATQQSLS